MQKASVSANFKGSDLFLIPVINLLLQFDLRVGLVFSIQRKLIGRRLPCWKFSLISREDQVTLKHGFNGEDYTIGLSAQEVIPMVSGNTADSFSLWISHFLGLWFRDHLQWWTTSSILKEDSPLLQEHRFLSIHRSFPNGLGCFLSHPQPLVCGIRKSQDSTLHNIVSNVVILKNDSEVSFWIEISFIFSDNLLVVAYMNSQGGIHS